MSAPDSRGRLSGSSDRSKYRFGRSRKRRRVFYGSVKDQPAPKRARSLSAQKIQTVVSDASSCRNRIIDVNILFPELEKLISCKQCHGKVILSETGFRGLGFNITVTCENCEQKTISSSKGIGEKHNSFEVNRRSVIAMRTLGLGHAGLSTLCGIMDLPRPIAHSFFDRLNEQLSQVCEDVAQSSMNEAVKEEIAKTPSADHGLGVSGDGSWRKKGFTSLQGITSLIGVNTGKVLDVNIKSSFCKACTKWEGKQDTEQFQEWFEEHKPKCSSNHEGCAGKMEVDGVVEMFQRSEEKYNIKYHHYIGDGDAKTFSAISAARPYGEDFIVEKKECVGHVQKRMGTRLRNLKKNLSGQKLADGKSIGGKGRLTGQVIDQLTIYYGNAIRAHSDSVEAMRNAIWATYYHQSSTDKKPQHHLCPKGESSWCKWQKAKSQRKLKLFKHKSAIPSAIMDKLKPIYEDLSNPELLYRCLGGFTQNNNESFNNSVWKLVPKTSFSGLTVLKIGVYMAVTCFNDGRSGFLKIMDHFDIKPGRSAIDWVKTSDSSRLFHAERKTEANTKEARQRRRNVRLQIPEDCYEPGQH